MSKRETFTLLNPQIKGSYRSTIKKKTPVEAARTFYENLSSKISNSVRGMFMVVGDQDDNLHHFYIQEDLRGGKTIQDARKIRYTIHHFEPSFSDGFNNRVKKTLRGEDDLPSLKGGKRRSKDDSDSDSDLDFSDSSDSDSDSDTYRKRRSRPYITDYYYHVLPYPTIRAIGLSAEDIRKYLFFPNFYEITPYIRLNWELVTP